MNSDSGSGRLGTVIVLGVRGLRGMVAVSIVPTGDKKQFVVEVTGERTSKIWNDP